MEDALGVVTEAVPPPAAESGCVVKVEVLALP